jgi:hypothetical protein
LPSTDYLLTSLASVGYPINFRSPTAKLASATWCHCYPIPIFKSSCVVIGYHQSPNVPGLLDMLSIKRSRSLHFKNWHFDSIRSQVLRLGLDTIKSQHSLDWESQPRQFGKDISTVWKRTSRRVMTSRSRLLLTVDPQALKLVNCVWPIMLMIAIFPESGLGSQNWEWRNCICPNFSFQSWTALQSQSGLSRSSPSMMTSEDTSTKIFWIRCR